MREGMKCKVVLSTLDDGTLMVKEIKWQKNMISMMSKLH
jgi:hypothetical protein